MKPPFLIDVSRLYYRKLRGRPPTGIDRVALEYVRHYADQARAVLAVGRHCTVLSPEDSARVFRALLAPRTDAPMGEAAGLVAKACLRGWRREDVSGCVLLNTSPASLEDEGCAIRLAGQGARLVSLVYDLIPITHPEYCRPGERERHLARMRGALTAVGGLISISDDTLAALREHAGEAGLRLPPAVVAPLASSLPAINTGPRPIAAPYFVVVGTIEPRKNHLLLLQLWRELVRNRQDSRLRSHSEPVNTAKNGQDSQDLQDSNPETQDTRFKTQGSPHPSPLTPHAGMSDATPRLVIVGQRGWECENVADLLERCESLQGSVIERGRCDDAELVTWLSHAQALLFPSFAEGYGLPLAEALALGTPAIAADRPVFREAAGEIPDYVDPLDGRRWMELISEYSNPASARRAAQIERMKGFRASTWQRHFQTVDGFIEEIINCR